MPCERNYSQKTIDYAYYIFYFLEKKKVSKILLLEDEAGEGWLQRGTGYICGKICIAIEVRLKQLYAFQNSSNRSL